MSGQRRAMSLLPVMLALLLVPALWSVRHDTPPLGPDADLYTSLSVARHLLRGDGFANGVVYPVSLGFPFAASVPQPLIERPPGVPLTVLPAVALAGDVPGAAVTWAQRWWLVWLGLLAAAGASLLQRRGLGVVAVPWGIGLVLSPLLAMATAWCQVEVVVALLALLLWGRSFPPPHPRRSRPARLARRDGGVDGLLWGGIALLRPELVWLPPLWLVLGGLWRDSRRWRTALLVCALLLLPWSVRSLRLTHRPWFMLQTWTEHLKETPAAPGYSIYCSPRGEPLTQTLLHQPGLVVAKTAAGWRYYLGRLHRWFRPGAWAWLLLAALWPGMPGRHRARIALVTVLLLTALYSPFSHTLRYLVVVLPILLLEFWSDVTVAVTLVTERRWLVPAAAVGLGLLLSGGVPERLPGWEHARSEAARLAPLVPAAARRAEAAPPGPLLSDSAAVLWLARRDGVWWPGPGQPPDWLRRAAPGLAGAPWIRLTPNSVDQGQDQSPQQAER